MKLKAIMSAIERVFALVDIAWISVVVAACMVGLISFIIVTCVKIQ